MQIDYEQYRPFGFNEFLDYAEMAGVELKPNMFEDGIIDCVVCPKCGGFIIEEDYPVIAQTGGCPICPICEQVL